MRLAHADFGVLRRCCWACDQAQRSRRASNILPLLFLHRAQHARIIQEQSMLFSLPLGVRVCDYVSAAQYLRFHVTRED